MKKMEQTKKPWIWLILGVAALLVAAAVCLVLFLKPAAPQQDQTPEEPQVTYTLVWNLDGKAFTENSETGLSTREPGEDGLFTLRFADAGQVKEYKTADRQLVYFIDSMDILGLVFDDSGLIVDAVQAKDAATEIAKEFYVRTFEGGSLEVNSSMAMNGMPVTVQIGEDARIMDVRPDAPDPGASAELQTMDRVYIYGTAEGKATHVFLAERKPKAGVYIRVEKHWNAAAGCTSRTPDENGVYTVLMAHEGQQVEMKCKDKNLVNAIDSGDDANQFKGLFLDEEGYITDVVTVNEAIRGLLKCNVYHVTNIEGNTITTERLLFHGGQIETFEVDDTTKIFYSGYLLDGCFDFIGQQVDSLQLDDRLIVYTDVFNTAKYIFLTHRMVDVPLYYNPTIMYDGQATTRPKDTNGYYVFEMGCEGKTVKVKTKDKDLATYIEKKYMQIMGLEVKNGVIKKAYDQSCVTGFLPIGTNCSVTEVSGNIVRIVPGGNPEAGANYVLSADAKVYNATGDYGTKFFQKDTLQQYDGVTALRDKYGDVCYVMIHQRYRKGTKIYYNIGRRYDGVKQETTRVPDAEGYYVFDTLCDGKRQKVKTKSKEIATIIDRQYSPFAALKVSSDGIVKEAYPAASSMPAGTKCCNYNYVGKLEGNALNTYYYTDEGELKWQSATFKIAKDCKVYNVGENYDKAFGEKTTLKMHDQIQAFASGENQEITAIYVLTRKLDGNIYWPVNPQFDSAKLESTRTPDADGWYYVDLAYRGEVKTYKTKVKAVIDRVDSYSTGLAMEVKGDVIQKAGAASTSKNYGSVVANGLDVTKVSSKKVTAQRTRPTATDYGLKVELQLATGCKIYDVSYFAENFGAPTTLQVGDRIVGYTNKDGKVCEIYVMYKNTHKDGPKSLCPHCDKEVFWQPFLGVVYEGDDHYYMAGDFLTWQQSVGKDDAGATTWDVVLDLNGKTLSSYGRNFLVYDKLTVLDLAGGGRLEGAGVDGWAGNFLVLNGGELTLTAGTVTPTAEAKIPTQGGLIYAQNGCTVNMTGGILEQGKTTGSGGAIYLSGSTLNISGGEIKDCTASQGNGIYMTGTSTVNISGSPTVSCIEGAEGSKLTLSGAPKIGELTVPKNSKLTLGELTGEAEITVLANGIFTEPTENAEVYQNYFKPAMGHEPITVVENALHTAVDTTLSNDSLVFLEGTQDAWCSVCHKLVTWTPITGEESFVQMLGSHYYLEKDITVSVADNGKEGYLYVSGSGQSTTCLHLNGKNLTVTDHRAIMGGPRTLNVLGQGTVSGCKTGAGNTGAAVHANAGKGLATVNLYGGTYTKSDSDTESAILYIGYNGGTINMYEDVTVDATGKTSTLTAAGVHVQGGEGDAKGPGMFTMYGGLIKNGNTTKAGGNLNITNAYATANLLGGIIEGGKATGDGGNIYCTAGTLKLGAVTVRGGIAGGEGGNLRIKNAKPVMIKGAQLLGGEATSHGGNVSVTRANIRIEEGTLIDGGHSKGYGGSFRVYQADVLMTGGEIKGGTCAVQVAHNVWLAGSAAVPARFYMQGGTVYATPNFNHPGSGIYAFENAKVYLLGDATVIDGDGATMAGLRASANSRICIVDGWSGSANIRWAEQFASGATVTAAYGQVVTLDGSGNETGIGGSFTGTLLQLFDGTLQVVADTAGNLLLQQPQ